MVATGNKRRIKWTNIIRNSNWFSNIYCKNYLNAFVKKKKNLWQLLFNRRLFSSSYSAKQNRKRNVKIFSRKKNFKQKLFKNFDMINALVQIYCTIIFGSFFVLFLLPLFPLLLQMFPSLKSIKEILEMLGVKWKITSIKVFPHNISSIKVFSFFFLLFLFCCKLFYRNNLTKNCWLKFA